MKLHFVTLPDPVSGARAKVYGPNGYGEFLVRFYNSKGKLMDASDAYASTLEDALDTCLAQCRLGIHESEEEPLTLADSTTRRWLRDDWDGRN